ncbi:universal stress protein [Hoyosella rhizosphaerae]|uniref:Universal stress protein n=1 Tax=Hoyosella rhizosphaerae TaxID=1755582 RepID=A0A916X938_9ACTN|nr:universal stress protein [Hoyosella rhizosphaerae]MBN4927142.1 universal stress protein [Hoyosella rhizosphaerae]GGC53656.1 universal stress protein [Hoyosella rhizosphaerae]
MADAPPAKPKQRKVKPTPPIDKLIVPLDGTFEAEAAITPALKIARQLHVPLELFTVHDPVHGRWATGIDSLAADTEYDDVEVVCVSAGWAGDHLVQMSQESAGAVICLATHNRDRFSRMVTGSVTEHVIRQAPCPVLMVGPHYDSAFEPDQYRDCIVCLDGSVRDEAALHTARHWARQLDLGLRLVHIDSPGRPEEPQVYESALETLTRELTEAGIRTEYAHITHNDVADGIRVLQSEMPGSLTIVTSRNRGVSRWVVGSTTLKVLANSPSPVVLADTSYELHGRTSIRQQA